MSEQSWINDQVDRAKWADPSAGAGEPDKAQWKDATTGLDCLANRHPTSGHWCGYVGVAPGHKFYGKGYDDVRLDGTDDTYIDVHGGLTFAGECEPSDAPCRGVCHVPAPGEPDTLWWLGFDCAHSGDVSPGYDHGMQREWHSTYKSLAYVKSECAKLAAQLAA